MEFTMTETPKQTPPRRANAEEKLEEHRRRDEAYFAEMHRVRAMNEAKTARLRDQRLAKEAADRANRMNAPPPKGRSSRSS
jgi:hypothetical protein